MVKGLLCKSVLIISTITIITSAVFSALFYIDNDQHGDRTIQVVTNGVADIVSELVVSPLQEQRYDEAENILSTFFVVNDTIQSISIQHDSIIDPERFTIAAPDRIGDYEYTAVRPISINGTPGVLTVKGLNNAQSHLVHDHAWILGIMALVLTVFFTLILSGSIHRLLIKPIQILKKHCEEITKGNYDSPIHLNQVDELGRLGKSLEKMRLHIKGYNEHIESQYAKMEQRVEKRSKELSQLNLQLVQSEKMASVGVLAAGVAHEVNNPIGIITSNLDLLEGYFDDMDELIRAYEAQDGVLKQAGCYEQIHESKAQIALDELRDRAPDSIQTAMDCLERVSTITGDLLRFSRKGDGSVTEVDVGAVINESIKLFKVALPSYISVNYVQEDALAP